MGTLPDIIILANDSKIISSISENPITEKCNLHLANKNDMGLNKIKLKKYNLIAISIETPSPTEIQYFDKVAEICEDTPLVVISPFYVDNWPKIFGGKINKFIRVPFTQEQLQKSLMNVILCKNDEESQEARFTGKLDKKKLLMLFKLSQEFAAIDDTTELFYTISKRAMEAFNSERASVFVLNKARTELISRVAIGMENRLIKIPVGKGVVGRVIQTGETYITNDPKSSPYFNDSFDKKTGFQTRNIICVPLKNFEGKIIGAFELINKKEGEFNDEDKFYLENIGATIAISLENTLLHHFMKRQINELNLLKEKFVHLKNKQNMTAKTKHILDDISSKLDGNLNAKEVLEKLDILKKMLKGNPKAMECIARIEEFATTTDSLLESLVKHEAENFN